jgi:hypothetical protein
VVAAAYHPRRGRVVVRLRSGLELSFDPCAVQGVTEAKAADLRIIEISPLRRA